MRKLHRTVFSLAGLALAAGTALSAAPPAGAATTALMDFPSGRTTGYIVNVNSGLCLQPSGENFFGNGDPIVQRGCNGSVAQLWVLVPIGTKSFYSGVFFSVDHASHRIFNAGSGLCLDDRDGISSDGAAVQQWACNTTSTTMQWGAFPDLNGNHVIANVRASNKRSHLIVLGVEGESVFEDAPVQLFEAGQPPPSREWVYQQVS
jgi:hypothetical protein